MSRELKYTESGQARLENLSSDLQSRIEEELRMRRFVPGDDFIEVTGSDIDELRHSMRISFLSSRSRRLEITSLLMRLYLLLGVVLTLAGLAYPFLDAIRENPTRFVLVTAGVMMVVLSAVMSYWIRMRQRRFDGELRLQRDKDSSVRAPSS